MFKRNKFIWFSCLFILFLLQNCFAATLADWKDPKAYKPKPILFLHGFNANSGSWQTAINSLHKLYSNYQPVGTFLELIDFQDNIGSVDTYFDGSKGWADVLSEKIKQLLDKTKYGSYTTNLNLVSYSMGGLAAREFLTNSKYGSGYVDKLILIGVPNLGSPLIYGPRGLCEVSKFGTMMSPRLFLNFCSFRNNLNDFAKLILIPNLEILDAVKDMTPGSDFLNKLNNRAQPFNVQYYGIYGIIRHILNRMFFGSFEGGDGIVSEKSQLGTDRITFKELPIKIKAFHTAEPVVAVTEGNPLLKLLDSASPEFTFDDPVENSTTEINTNSISIKGRVFKEYLPADSEIIISGFRQEDGAVLNRINSLLKPSSFWISNNPDSPVAEFDETIAFPGQGTYKISCQIQNPAGLLSDTKVFWVKVMTQSTANIIVHGHNPEGKEINSITGFANTVAVYDGSTRIGYAGNTPITIPSGHHTINVKFNGMTLTQVIDISNGETQELTFTFTRTEIIWGRSSLSTHYFAPSGASGSGSDSSNEHGDYFARRFFENYISPDIYCYGEWGGPTSGSGTFVTSGFANTTVSSEGVTVNAQISLTKGADCAWMYADTRVQWYGVQVTVIPPVPPTQGFDVWYDRRVIIFPGGEPETLKSGEQVSVNASVYSAIIYGEDSVTDNQTASITYTPVNISDIILSSVPYVD